MFLSIKNKNSSNSGDLDLNSNPHSNIVAEDSVKRNHFNSHFTGLPKKP